MKNMKRILVTVVAAVLLMAVTVAGTVAFLQAKTDTVENTFAVGNVSFDKALGNGLDEAEVDEYGENPQGRTTENEYKIVPNHEYIKDPTLHIAKGSESCYVFVTINKTGLTYTKDGKEINIEAASSDAYKTIKQQIEANWTQIDTTEDGDLVYVYNKIVNTLKDEKTEDIVLFSKFLVAETAVIPSSDNADAAAADAEVKEMLAELQINITGYAVQADTFATDDADNAAVVASEALKAWDATYGAPKTAAN